MLHLPNNPRDWALFLLFCFGGVFTIVYETFYILPKYRSFTDPIALSLLGLMSFIAVQMYLSMYKLLSTDVTIHALQTPTPSNPESYGWKFCSTCNVYAPPRSHHCKVCDICILKRDHHCWYAGYCIGYANHRHFICLAVYGALAGTCAVSYNWEFSMDVMGGFSWTTIPELMCPHAGFVFGFYSIFEFFIIITTSISIMFTLFFIALSVMQVLQFVKGQVMYERRKGITDYSLGLKNTFHEIFGTTGLLVFLCPFIRTKLQGDGSYFKRRHMNKDK